MKDFNDIERNDDLSQLFRNSAENLEASPSYTAWDKLERKLDSRRLRKRAVIYRYTSMIAAGVGIVALLMVFKLLNKVETLDKVLSSEPIAQLEEAPLTEDERRIARAIEQHKKEAEQVEEIRKVMPTQPIETVSSEVVAGESDDEEKEPIAFNFDNNEPKPQVPKVQKPRVAKKELAQKEDLSKSNGDAGYSDAEISSDVEVEEEEIAEEAKPNDYLVVVPESPRKSSPRLNSAGNPVTTKDENEKVAVADAKRDNKTIVTVDKERINQNTIPNRIESNAKKTSSYGKKRKKESSKTTLTQFNWMAGKWKDALKSDSYEEWFLDDKEIVGEGYILVDGKKEFSEYMRVYQSGKSIYFESSVDETKKIRKFKLKSYKGNQATFERKSRKFPNKVTITQVSNGAFRITYMNKNDDNISESQAKYFNTRNNISVERASRNMNRY